MNYSRKIILGLAILMALAVMNCIGDDPPADIPIPLPYPDMEQAAFFQAQIDSSDFLWFTDIKAAASSFVNEFGYVDDGISTTSVRILGEGIFHGTVEVELPDRILTLTMERPFKQKGKQSLWQVTKLEEKPWQKQESR